MPSISFQSKVKLPELTKYRFRPSSKDNSLEELLVHLELKPSKAITAETPANPDDLSHSFSSLDQWDLVSPMPGQPITSGIWAQRAEYPGTPLEPREDSIQVVTGGSSTPGSRRFSGSRCSYDSPPTEVSYRGAPLQGAWTKPLGVVSQKACCTPPPHPPGFVTPAPTTPPTSVSHTPAVTAVEPHGAARKGATLQRNQCSLVRHGSHPPNVSLEASKSGGEGGGGGAQDVVQRRRHGSMQVPAHKGAGGSSGTRRASQQYKGSDYQRSESDSHTTTGPVGPGDQRRNTSEPLANRAQGGGAKTHRVKR